MKVLFWQWNAFMQKGIEKAFEKRNIQYKVLYQPLKNWECDEAFARRLEAELDEESYDAVFSVNYAPVLSNVCEEKKIKYISWVYDSPIHIRDISSFHNSCNRIYFFDRGQMESYRKQGYETVYHLPLAADETVWDFNGQQEQYNCDVAFVGQLYKSDYDYLMGPLPQYYRGMMDGILGAQGQIYGAYILEEMITDALMLELNEHYKKASGGKSQVKREEMIYACACEITGRERFMALSLLAKRCRLHLYSKDSGKDIVGAYNGGYVDYYTQMPKAFRNAKININISLKTIQTGIPLRVLDVLSCGGFLITNYQPEIMEYFEPGVDLVLYEDVKDLVYKVDYYLKHEKERREIALNGQKKVRELFTFENRITKMFG